MNRTHVARCCLYLAFVTVCFRSAPVFAQTVPTEAKPGDPVILRLDSGEPLYGELVSHNEETVVLRISGVETTIQNRHIERITVQRSAVERYRSMRAIIDDTDTERLLLLIDWLIQQDMLQEARRELDAVLAAEPSHPEARRISTILNQRIQLKDRSTAASPQRVGAGADPERARARQPGRFKPGEFPLLTDEQVNLLKVYELDLQNPPRILIDREAVSRFLNDYSGAAGMPRTELERKEFFRKPPSEILELMFRLRARELYSEVKVIDLPHSLSLFRDNVAGGWLVRGCSSTSCHGGTDAPPPHFFTKRPFSESTALTNFIILDRFRLADGSPLIDYERPGDSAFLQMGLPVPDSSHPHPDVPGWRPVFRSRDARRFRETIEWLNSMIRPRPEPPIQYEPPRLPSRGESETASEVLEPADDLPPQDQPR